METEEKKDRKPTRYHLVYHGEKGVETLSFDYKKDLQIFLRGIRPESIVGMYRGSKLHAEIKNVFQIV